ncbi:MAG: autotransporter domain-containing protein [Methylocella sp.]
MTISRSALCVTTALTGGALALLLAPSAAHAQCATPPSSFSSSFFTPPVIERGKPPTPGFTTTSTFTLPGFSSGGVGALSAITSVVSTLSAADASLSAQGSSPFVVTSPTQAPDQLGGGVWVRGAGGSFRVSAPTTGVTFDSFPTANEATVSATDCSESRTRQDFTGVQVGADVARLNFGGSGGTLNVGLTSGYFGLSSSDNLFSTSFQVPFFGLYATATYGNFFADAQIRGNFYDGSLFDAGSGLSGQNFNARGFTLSGNIGYHSDLPDNWFIEPSVGVNWARTFVDPMSFAASTTVTTTTGFPPTTSSASALGTSALNINDFDSILGRASLRVGTTFVNGQYIFQPYFTASVFHEFAAQIGSTLNTTLTGLPSPLPPSIFESSIFSTGRIGTYGQFGLGLVGQIANTGWTSFVRADYQTGDRFEGWDVTGGARYTFDPERGLAAREGRSAEPGVVLAPPPYNWTGVFLGISAPGALWGEGKWNFGGLAGNAANNFTGVLAGGGGGFNYQMGALVLGGAAEWDWTNARGGESFDCPASGFFSNNCANRVNNIFTATARVGYAYDRLLVYGQGGLAVGDVVAQTTFNAIPGNPTISDSKTSVGWTAGAGFEFGLTENISAKAEYLYFDLGSDTYNLAAPVAINRTGNIGRVGLNYRFNWGGAPIVAKY